MGDLTHKLQMSLPRLNLLMLRVADLERAANFYRLLGLEFIKHAHGLGPEHYACERPGFVFELYLASPKQPVSASTRLGFAIVGIDQLVTNLAAAGLTVLSAPRDSEWGRRALVVDPDGHRVELLESQKIS
jgi:lactoylglutathione lyase